MYHPFVLVSQVLRKQMPRYRGARDLLGVVPVRDQGQRSRSRQGEPSDRDVDLASMKGQAEGRVPRKECFLGRKWPLASPPCSVIDRCCPGRMWLRSKAVVEPTGAAPGRPLVTCLPSGRVSHEGRREPCASTSLLHTPRGIYSGSFCSLAHVTSVHLPFRKSPFL